MYVYINGDRVEVEAPTLLAVLENSGYECKKIVVAVNETFVARAEWALTELTEGDRLDVLGRIEGG